MELVIFPIVKNCSVQLDKRAIARHYIDKYGPTGLFKLAALYFALRRRLFVTFVRMILADSGLGREVLWKPSK
jgi:hypothetical protein